jgi:proline iminopeptidase
MNPKRRRAHDRLAALPGVHKLRRPLVPSGSGEFDLYYVRSGPQAGPPLVIIPGGPGAASIGQYRHLRRRAVASGRDVIMVEHRGIGMSRHDDAGADLPAEALTIDAAVDDIAAVLAAEQVEDAVIYGTSYGTYLAAGLGVRHPDLVHAMALDSPLLCADDIDAVRQATRAVLWNGTAPNTEQLAATVRRLVRDGTLTPWSVQLAAGLYGLVGPEALQHQLELLVAGRGLLWSTIGRGTRLLFEGKTPYRHEPDLVEHIGYRELNYGAAPDGLPLDPAVAFRESATGEPDFVAEPYDLLTQMPKFDWPTVVISGGRDLTTPPAVAQHVTELIPGARLVELPTAGHSVLDMRERSALEIITAVYADRIDELPGRAVELDQNLDLSIQLLVRGITTATTVESLLPPIRRSLTA